MRKLIDYFNSIDLVHAADACYCKECIYSRQYGDWDRSTQQTVVWYECKLFNYDVDANDFCSRGVKKRKKK